jgi:hypothetical protein
MHDIYFLSGGALLALIALGCVIVAWRSEGRLAAISETPTLRSDEIVQQYARVLAGQGRFGERCEISGIVECDTPIQAPRSGIASVAYRYVVNEENEQEVRVRSGSRRVSREFEYNSNDDHSRRVARFYVRDAVGRTLVDPTQADLELKETFARYEEFTNGLGSEREIWRHEHALPIGHKVYVLGYLGNAGGEAIIGGHPLDKHKRALISYRDEQELQANTRGRAYSLYFVGGIVGGIAALLLAFPFVW